MLLATIQRRSTMAGDWCRSVWDAACQHMRQTLMWAVAIVAATWNTSRRHIHPAAATMNRALYSIMLRLSVAMNHLMGIVCRSLRRDDLGDCRSPSRHPAAEDLRLRAALLPRLGRGGCGVHRATSVPWPATAAELPGPCGRAVREQVVASRG